MRAAVVILTAFQGFNVLVKQLPVSVTLTLLFAPRIAISAVFSLSATRGQPARDRLYGMALAGGILLVLTGLIASLLHAFWI